MKSILFCFLVATKLIAALPATGVFNVTTSGASTGGSMFNAARGGTDYSLQAAAQLHLTDLTTSGAASTTITSVTGGFAPAMVGNAIHIISGTNFVAGWYEIVTYTNTNNVILDRAPGAVGAGSIGDGYVGGSFKIGTVNFDDNFFEAVSSGTTCYIKSGTYTPGEVIGVATAGPLLTPAKIIGYTSVQGDTCNGNSRPKLLLGANSILFTCGVNNMQFETTSALGLQCRGTNQNVRVVNKSTTVDRIAFNTFSSTMLIDCEGICYRGFGANMSGADSTAIRCVFHSSKTGLQVGVGSNSGAVIDCILHSNYLNQILVGTGQIARYTIQGNTIFGTSAASSTVGMNLVTGSLGITFLKNIIYGCSTGVLNVDTQTVNYDDYNDYFNNTNDVSSSTQWQKGSHCTSINPVFTGVGQLTGLTATTTAGNHLIQSGADFSGVVPDRDFLVLISGSGTTAGTYGIASVDSATQITTDIAIVANATADHVWRITNGHDFSVGYAMKGLGGHVFQNGDSNSHTTDYADQGAAQRLELSSDGIGGDAVFSK